MSMAPWRDGCNPSLHTSLIDAGRGRVAPAHREHERERDQVRKGTPECVRP